MHVDLQATPVDELGIQQRATRLYIQVLLS